MLPFKLLNGLYNVQPWLPNRAAEKNIFSTFFRAVSHENERERYRGSLGFLAAALLTWLSEVFWSIFHN